MFKKNLFLIITILLTLFLSSCGNSMESRDLLSEVILSKEDRESSYKQDVTYDNCLYEDDYSFYKSLNLEKYVTLTIDALNETSIILSMRNESDVDLSTGYIFVLEHYTNGEWVLLPNEQPPPAITVELLSHDVLTYEKDLTHYLPMKPGRYRISNQVDVSSWSDIGELNWFVAWEIATEFEMKVCP